MFWFIIAAVAAIIIGLCVAVLVFAGAAEETPGEAGRWRAKALGALIGTLVLFIIVSLPFMWRSIDAGTVGLVKAFGAYTGVKEAGPTLIWPWESVQEARIRNASHELRMDGGPNGSAASKESQEVFVVATVNYSLAKECVQRLYTNYGSDYYATVIEPRARQIFKAESVRFAAVDILPNREQIRKETQEALAAQLNAENLFGEGCVTGLDFLLTNVGFGPEFTKAIEEKQVATQQAAAEENRVAIARNKASQLVATAQGEARQTRIRARADAYANRLRSKNLTPALVEWERIQKWQPEIIYLPSGSIVAQGLSQRP